MRFRIHNLTLSDFFREYHADVLGDPQYKRGDVTEMNSRVFDDVATGIWGLRYESYDHPHYTFRVIDQEKLERVGLESRGQVLV